MKFDEKYDHYLEFDLQENHRVIGNKKSEISMEKVDNTSALMTLTKSSIKKPMYYKNNRKSKIM